MTILNTCTITVIVLWEAAVTCPVCYQSRQDDGEIEIALALGPGQTQTPAADWTLDTNQIVHFVFSPPQLCSVRTSSVCM